MSTVLAVNEFKFLIQDDGTYIKRIQFLEENSSLLESTDLNPLLASLKDELAAYFSGSLTSFSTPYKLEGSPFQIRVWELMKNIGYGQVRSYGELAKELGGKNYARAVGGACNKNPLPVLIPCHRVSASNHIGGFAFGLSTKEKLLKLEKSIF